MDKRKKKLLIWSSIGLLMILAGLLIWREFSFIISGLGLVVIGIGLMIFFNDK
jgi:hypothetical protein